MRLIVAFLCGAGFLLAQNPFNPAGSTPTVFPNLVDASGAIAWFPPVVATDPSGSCAVYAQKYQQVVSLATGNMFTCGPSATWQPVAASGGSPAFSSVTGNIALAQFPIGAATNQVVYFNGTAWVLGQLAYSQLSGSQAFTSLAGTLALTQLPAGASTNQVAYFNGTSWVLGQLAYSQLSGTPGSPAFSGVTGNIALNQFPIGAATNQLAYYNGTAWVLAQLAYSQLSGLPTIPTVTGGTCTNQVTTSISTAAVPGCATVTSTMTDTSIAKTGTDINTSNQVTVTHLAAPLTRSQGGTGENSITGIRLANGTSPDTAAAPGTNYTASVAGAANQVGVTGTAGVLTVGLANPLIGPSGYVFDASANFLMQSIQLGGVSVTPQTTSAWLWCAWSSGVQTACGSFTFPDSSTSARFFVTPSLGDAYIAPFQTLPVSGDTVNVSVTAGYPTLTDSGGAPALLNGVNLFTAAGGIDLHSATGMNALRVPNIASCSTGLAGALCLDSTAGNLHMGTGSDLIVGGFLGTLTNNDIPKITVTSGRLVMADAGILYTSLVQAVAPAIGFARFPGSSQVQTGGELSGDCTSSGSFAVACSQLGSDFTVTRATGVPSKISNVTTAGLGVPITILVNTQTAISPDTSATVATNSVTVTTPGAGLYEVNGVLTVTTLSTNACTQNISLVYTDDGSNSITASLLSAALNVQTGSPRTVSFALQNVWLGSGSIVLGTIGVTVTDCATGTPKLNMAIWVKRVN